MKKFTLFLTTLCFSFIAMAQEVTVTELSQLSDDKAYFIETARCFLMYDAQHPDKISTSTAKNLGTTVVRANWEDANQQFNIKKIDDSYYLYSIGAQKYVTKDGSFSDNATDALQFVKESGDYPWKLLIGGNGMNSQEANQLEYGIVLNDWTQTDPGNCYKILDIATSTVVEVDYPNELSELKSDKCYTITTKARGGWSVELNNEGQYIFCSTNDALDSGNADTAEHFAVVTNDGENYYLYNVLAKKFVKADCTMVAGVADAIAFVDASAEGSCRVMVYFKDYQDKYINLGGDKQMVVNEYNTIDAGNAVAFIEAGDFNPTEALAMLAGGNATAIEKIESENESAEIYDLCGRKVENPTKGVYIIGGIKQLIK